MAIEVSGRRARYAIATLIVVLLALAASVEETLAQLTMGREYEIKAGFLFNFANFVDFPEGVFKSSSDELRIQVIGHDAFDGALDRLVAGKKVQGHPVVVSYSRASTAAQPAHVVFISRSEQKRVDTILAMVRSSPTLTVSDIDGFAERGGIIGLMVKQGSVRFAINRGAAQQARLRISSRLLSLATLVGGSEPLAPQLK